MAYSYGIVSMIRSVHTFLSPSSVQHYPFSLPLSLALSLSLSLSLRRSRSLSRAPSPGADRACLEADRECLKTRTVLNTNSRVGPALAPVESRHFDTLLSRMRAREMVDSLQKSRCKTTWKREFKLPWREAGQLDHQGDKADSDQ